MAEPRSEIKHVRFLDQPMSSGKSQRPSLPTKPAIPVKPGKDKQILNRPNSCPESPIPSVAQRIRSLEEGLNIAEVVQRMMVARSYSVDVPSPQGILSPHTGRQSHSNPVNNKQRKNVVINPDKKGPELERHRFERRDDSDLIGVVAMHMEMVNEKRRAALMGEDGGMLPVPRKTDHERIQEADDVDVWVYSPVSMLMKQIEDSVEMPMVNFSTVAEAELVKVLSFYDEDIEKSRIHFISKWNEMVNELLERSGYSLSSDFCRNVASLILSKLDLDCSGTLKCLSNDGVKMTVARYVSELEQNGHLADSTLSLHQHNEDLRKNPEIWNVAIENVIASALECIEQKCQICWDTLPSDKMFGLFTCQCIVCNPCMQRYFVLMIHDGYVANFVCPVCRLPDVEEVDDATLHFQLLEPRLKTLLSEEDFDAYQRKMTEWNLVRNPNFRWCINATCHSGFLIEENSYNRVICQECGMKMCHKCKKPWEEQHEGLTCELFKEWKESNDPQFQEAGLAQQLQENGIDCPRCQRRYLMSKGGCIHFTCTFCHYEFCSSCSRPFVRSCKKWNHCKQSGGLHCHHPRNCLYYLRDRSVGELQKLLKIKNVSYNTDSQIHVTTCPVLEEQDTDIGFTHELCKKSILPGHAGLCEKHYKEYLAGMIQRHQIDPAEIMTQRQLIRELRNSGITDVPKQHTKETPDQYHCRLAQLLMAKVMLPKHN